MAPQFNSYDDFFLFYLQQHRNPANRALHVTGTSLGVLTVIVAIVLGHPWWAFLWLPIAYGCAWTGHLLLEKNRPATFGHPFWSFISDFRMVWLIFTGQLEKWMEKGALPTS